VSALPATPGQSQVTNPCIDLPAARREAPLTARSILGAEASAEWGNSHLSNTHRYQSNDASYFVRHSNSFIVNVAGPVFGR
jgi:hypothetical protein